VLLSDPEVIRFVNENFIPCWQMVRPVPRVTIEFGGGRKLTRTLGGNTVIEICLPGGQVVDSFPGLYTPEDLLKEAGQTLELVRTLALEKLDGAVAERVIAWHTQRCTAPPAARTPLSVEKALVESPLRRALRAQPGTPPATDLLAVDLGRMPVTVGEGESPQAALVRITRQLEDVSKQPSTIEQLRQRFLALPEGQRPTPEQLGAMALRVDSRTNVNWVRPAVHLLFAGYRRLPQGTACRDTVFKQLLHIPVDDPYLGLAEAVVPGTPGGENPVVR
jgi:hypothetical protein